LLLLKEKPKSWEVILMAATGFITLVQLAWVSSNLAVANVEHQVKLNIIKEKKEAALAEIPREEITLKSLSEIDREVLSWLAPDFDNGNNEIQHFAADWSVNKFKRCLEVLPFLSSPAVAKTLTQTISEKTGKTDYNSFFHTLWLTESNSPSSDPTYADFKALLYRLIDPRFSEYFGHNKLASIALSEVMWGGVKRDGIPPLHKPNMVKAKEADYLADDDLVFGLFVNGDSRAYPKRILAWHEMFTDTVGGQSIVGVYCTLCGTMIPYHSTINGTKYDFGTSGFLYRSNKLMYDKQTKSLWSTTAGEPVIGTLVGKNLKMHSSPVVTTTWGNWRKLHPETTVLSLDTGYSRDYGEGVAYHDYFSTDDLMFPVQSQSGLLPNKAEVLVLPWAYRPRTSISQSLLIKKPIYQTSISGRPILVVTDSSGANRVYETTETFASLENDKELIDGKGRRWSMNEDHIQCITSKEIYLRLPAHRAFWFGWHAAYPNGRLIN